MASKLKDLSQKELEEETLKLDQFACVNASGSISKPFAFRMGGPHFPAKVLKRTKRQAWEAGYKLLLDRATSFK